MRGKGKKRKEEGKKREKSILNTNWKSNFLLAKYSKQVQVCIQPLNTKTCLKSICFNIILHPINYRKLKEKAAGSCSHAGKSMLPNASVVPEINKWRKDGKRHQWEGFSRKGTSASSILRCFPRSL